MTEQGGTRKNLLREDNIATCLTKGDIERRRINIFRKYGGN